MEDLTGLNKDLKELAKRFKEKALDAVKVLAVDEFDKNFERESFFGEKWKPSEYVKRTRSGGKLLMKDGHLRKSIQKPTISGDKIIFTSNVPYAEIHNEGGTIKHPGGTAYLKKKGETIWISNRKAAGKKFPRTRAHDIKIPQRQFIGEHKKLDKMIEDEIDSVIKKMMDL